MSEVLEIYFFERKRFLLQEKAKFEKEVAKKDDRAVYWTMLCLRVESELSSLNTIQVLVTKEQT